MKLYSQCGQDEFVARWFKHNRGGLFVEIGAADGETWSNTCFLERELAWSGLCIEANPASYERLRQTRKCNTFFGAVGNHTEEIPFIRCTGELATMSARADVFDRERWQKLSEKWPSTTEQITVPMHKTQSVLDQFGLTCFDYLSIDVDGGELDVLEGIDWSKTKPTLVSVEDILRTEAIHKFMQKQGYITGCGLDWDYMFWKP